MAGAVLPCNSPLACLPLQAGGDAGSGYGYCTLLGSQAQQQGAAAITVSNRTSQSGAPCRLPIVYKCGPFIQLDLIKTVRFVIDRAPASPVFRGLSVRDSALVMG